MVIVDIIDSSRGALAVLQATLIVGVIAIALTVIYALYRVVWYTFLMLRLRVYLGKWNVKLVRPFRRILFGYKGEFNFVLRTKKERYSVAVVSYMAKRWRLNIEKKDSEYFINMRRKRFFSKEYYYNSAEPDHSVQYRSEKSVVYSRLRLEEPSDGTTPILLFYPKPRELTYADHDMKILCSGDKIGSHTVMFWDDLRALM